MVICTLLPRFELLAALGSTGERRRLLSQPVALAPEPNAAQLIGEVSGPAEAFGIRPGMRLGEALARCPKLLLIPPDRARAETVWEEVLRRLEAMGAAVEPRCLGEAYFEAAELRELWGEEEAVVAKARRAIAMPARLGAGAGRFVAHVAARRARPRRRPPMVPAERSGAFLSSEPVAVLHGWCPGPTGERLPEKLERLGLQTLGDLAALPKAAVADRFGAAGLRARVLARGGGRALRPRMATEGLAEWIELPDAAPGPQLERALELLIRRLLAHPDRRGRSFRRLRLTAILAGGGSWSSPVALRRSSASAERLGLALAPRLTQLPGPASRLGIEALVMGPPPLDQLSLAEADAGPEGAERRKRLAEAVRQARAAAGRDAILRILDLDPGSRIPERRLMLAPF